MMELRNGSLVGGSSGSLPADIRPAFEHGVTLILRRWVKKPQVNLCSIVSLLQVREAILGHTLLTRRCSQVLPSKGWHKHLLPGMQMDSIELGCGK